MFWSRNRENPRRKLREMARSVPKETYVGALDIGSHMVKVLIGVRRGKGIEIKSVGTAESPGIHQGKIRDVERTVKAIQSAAREAGSLLGIDSISGMPPMVVGVGGDSISGLCSFGLAVVNDEQITEDHITISLETANAVQLPEGHTLIQTVPQEFVVDHQRGVHNPLGMVALRLESWVYLVTAKASYVRNLLICAKRAGIEVESIAAIPVAVARSVLMDDEKEMGSVVIDIGENFTNLVVFRRGKLEMVTSLPRGGYDVLKGLSQVFQTSLSDARTLKDNYWELTEGYGAQEERLEVPLRGERGFASVPVREVESVLEKELEGLFDKVNSFLVNSRCKEGIEAGAVVTGGNAKIEMITQVAERILEMDVRVGKPLFDVDSKLAVTIKSPLYATAAGLLCFSQGKGSCGSRGEVLRTRRGAVREGELPMGVRVAGFLI